MEGVCSAQVQAQTSTAEDARRKDRPLICRQPWPILISTWPREVEEVLSKHEGIVEAAVIGIPDPVSSEAVKAFVVKKSRRAPDRTGAYRFLPRSDRRLQGAAGSGVYRCLAAQSIRQGAQA